MLGSTRLQKICRELIAISRRERRLKRVPIDHVTVLRNGLIQGQRATVDDLITHRSNCCIGCLQRTAWEQSHQ